MASQEEEGPLAAPDTKFGDQLSLNSKPIGEKQLSGPDSKQSDNKDNESTGSNKLQAKDSIFEDENHQSKDSMMIS